MSLSAHDALRKWEKGGLLTKKKAEELRSTLSEDHAQNTAIGIFSGIGAILIGLGVILFIASHWNDMTPTFKVILLLLGIVASAYSGYFFLYRKKGYAKTGLSLLFVNLLLFGASIFLIAQIYNLPLNYWWGAFLWCVVALYFAYSFQSRMHLWLSVPLFLLFIGWLRTATVTGFAAELDFLGSDQHSIITLLPLIGLMLVGASILHGHARALSFGTATLRHWGIFLITTAVAVSTADRYMLFRMMYLSFDTITAIILFVSIALVLIAVWKGKFVTGDGRTGLFALSGYILFFYLVAAAPRFLGIPIDSFSGYSEIPMLTGLFVISILLAFVYLLVTIWFGSLLKEPTMVNIGMLGTVVTITIQYFTWAFTLLNRSMFFIVGGLLILALSAGLEWKRKQILSSMK